MSSTSSGAEPFQTSADPQAVLVSPIEASCLCLFAAACMPQPSRALPACVHWPGCAHALRSQTQMFCRQCNTHSCAGHPIEQMMQPMVLRVSAAGVWVLLHAGWLPTMDAAVCRNVPHGPAAGHKPLASQDAVCEVRWNHAEEWSLTPSRISNALPSAVVAAAAPVDALGDAAMNEMSMHTVMCQACQPGSVI